MIPTEDFINIALGSGNKVKRREKIYFQVLNIDDKGLEMLHKIKTWWCIMINTDPLPDAPVSFKSMCITAASSAVWIILIARALYIM